MFGDMMPAINQDYYDRFGDMMPAINQDYYDRAVQYFMKKPNEIFQAWSQPAAHIYGELFAFVTHTRYSYCDHTERHSGCVTTIRYGRRVEAETEALTKAIKWDVCIPQISDNYFADYRGSLIEPSGVLVNTVGHNDAHLRLQNVLNHLADWQRRIDLELNRLEPEEPKWLADKGLITLPA